MFKDVWLLRWRTNWLTGSSAVYLDTLRLISVVECSGGRGVGAAATSCFVPQDIEVAELEGMCFNLRSSRSQMNE